MVIVDLDHEYPDALGDTDFPDLLATTTAPPHAVSPEPRKKSRKTSTSPSKMPRVSSRRSTGPCSVDSDDDLLDNLLADANDDDDDDDIQSLDGHNTAAQKWQLSSSSKTLAVQQQQQFKSRHSKTAAVPLTRQHRTPPLVTPEVHQQQHARPQSDKLVKKSTKPPGRASPRPWDHKSTSLEVDDQASVVSNIGMDEFEKYDRGGGPHLSPRSAMVDFAAQQPIPKNIQDLQQEVHRLQETLERKTFELQKVTSQLRRAVATKCDLVQSHTELKRSYETDVKRKEQELLELQKVNLDQQERRAATEVDMSHDMARLRSQLANMESTHRQALNDWERRHEDTMAQKDAHIAQLRAELHKLNQRSNAADSIAKTSVFGGVMFSK